MDSEEIKKQLEEQSKILLELRKEITRLKRYFLWSLIFGILVIVLPLIVAAIFLPMLLGNIFSVYGGLLQ